MTKFKVAIQISYELPIEVEARNSEEAKKKAEQCFVDWRSVNPTVDLTTLFKPLSRVECVILEGKDTKEEKVILHPNCGYFNEEIGDEYSPYPDGCEKCYRFDICKEAKENE